MGSGLADGGAAFLSIIFSLNLLLGVFNLIPLPPLDGFNALGLLLPESATVRLMNLRDSMGGMTMLGMLVAWRFFPVIFDPIYTSALEMLFRV
jgi:Zn-dependent protease